MILNLKNNLSLIFISLFFFYSNVNIVFSKEFKYENQLAYIDFQFIFQNSNVSKKLRTELNKAQKNYQSQIILEEEALNLLENKLNLKRKNVDKKTFSNLLSEFEKKVEITQKKIRLNKQTLDYNFQKHQKHIADEINKIVSEIAINNNILVVFKSNNIIYAEQKIDLTSLVLEEFNKKEIIFDFSDLEVKIFEEGENAS